MAIGSHKAMETPCHAPLSREAPEEARRRGAGGEESLRFRDWGVPKQRPSAIFGAGPTGVRDDRIRVGRAEDADPLFEPGW